MLGSTERTRRGSEAVAAGTGRAGAAGGGRDSCAVGGPANAAALAVVVGVVGRGVVGEGLEVTSRRAGEGEEAIVCGIRASRGSLLA